MVIDEVVIKVEAGAGGNGCLSFRREKYVPRGGPDGGNGGRGGDIFLEARTDVHTLVDFIYRPLFRAHYGQHGKGKNKHGKDEQQVVIKVPVGTMAWDEDHHLIVDLNKPGMRYLVARGGRGGKGNTVFATSTQRAPKIAEKGEPGEVKTIRLELKLLADVGIVGFPNAGKSTLLSRVTHANPKIAEYPFTTLEPQLGVVKLSEGQSFVLADVPGLIEGASEGRGLGIRFLRHLERTKLLLHLVDLSSLTKFSELTAQLKVINKELENHSSYLKKAPQIIVLTKLDTFPDKKTLKDWQKKLKVKWKNVLAISAVTGEGLNDLLGEIWKNLSGVWNAQEEKGNENRENIYQAKERFYITKEDDGFHVLGPEIEKWVAMTDFNNSAAVERFYNILGRMGVIKKMKKMGVKNGDTVFCDGEEMNFTHDYLEARSEA